jgi:hypothetical protein
MEILLIIEFEGFNMRIILIHEGPVRVTGYDTSK